ncbi:MAG: ATP-binding cassette domain-containing protein [Acidobacteriota bacterium]|nr:ATP-binding cassette domain-containing protein [Acidobacteriota bacterium]
MSAGFEVDVVVERRSRDEEAFVVEASFGAGPGITVVFGPSGAGKTTLALALVGAIRPARGRIVVSGRKLFDSNEGIDLPVRRRRVGVVFQDALLFPHMSVKGNVAFGLAGEPRDRREQLASEALDRVGAASLAGRLPGELSTGQRQRVALARALAARPSALVLDEPFSALDSGSRHELGAMLIELQAESGVPFLHVTHDLGEAYRLGNELVLIEDGRVAQIGSPDEVVSEPATASAARVLGTENLFTGVVEEHFRDDGHTHVDLGGTAVEIGWLDLPRGSRVALGVRAQDILVSVARLEGTSARNVIAGRIEAVEHRGAAVDLRVLTPVPFRVRVTEVSARELDLRPGREVFLVIKAHAFHHLR